MKRIDNNSENRCLCSTNHYALLATMKSNELNCGIINNSRRRYQLLESTLGEAAPRISKETLRTILSKRFPKGVCDHYYCEAFGTLWSAIFDLTSLKADVCFGAPTHNEWRSFALDEPVGVKEYPARAPKLGGSIFEFTISSISSKLLRPNSCLRPWAMNSAMEKTEVMNLKDSLLSYNSRDDLISANFFGSCGCSLNHSRARLVVLESLRKPFPLL